MDKIDSVGPYMILTKFDGSGHIAVAVPKVSTVEKVLHPTDSTEDYCIVTIKGEKYKVKETLQTILSGLRKI